MMDEPITAFHHVVRPTFSSPFCEFMMNEPVTAFHHVFSNFFLSKYMMDEPVTAFHCVVRSAILCTLTPNI
jgi:hypothetical protein